MKRTLWILFLLIAFGNIIMSESLRNLEDEIDTSHIIDIPSKTNYPSFPVDANSPVANKTKQTNKINAPIQIKKFYNYSRQTDKIGFSVFVYFLNKQIVKTIIMRFKIVYGAKILRRIEKDIEAESTKADCIIKEIYNGKIGQIIGTGVNIDYECVSITSSKASLINATLDTDYPLMVDEEEIDFDEINFDEEAAKESVNLVKIHSFDISGSLENSNIEWGTSSFKIIGVPYFDKLPSKGKEIKMKFINYSRNTRGTKNIYCTIEEISSSQCILNCDDTLSTYIREIPFTKSLDDSVFLMINLNKELKETGQLVGTTGDNGSIDKISKKKSSSGLSAGVIAGIVIGGVVVLVGITIAAIICCRKASKPPIDNKSGIDTRTSEVIYI